jgi:hypothetical protein
LSRVVPDPKDPTKTIVKRVVPEIGKIFAFTAAEVASIMKVSKSKPALRQPQADTQGTASVASVNRVAVPVTGSTPGTRSADAPAKPTRAESNAATVAATPSPGPAQPASGPPTSAKQAKAAAAAQVVDPEVEDHQL